MRDSLFSYSPISFDTPLTLIREALSSPDACARLDGNDLMVASEVAYRSGDLHLAVKAMEALVTRKPDDTANFCRLGNFHYLTGKLDEAAQAFERAIALDPCSEPAYQSLRQIHLDRRDVATALEIAERQQQLCGESANLTLMIAHLARQAGRYEQARELYAKLNASPHRTEETMRCEAEAAYDMGQFDQALVAARKAHARYPDSFFTGMLLANTLCVLRDFSAAIPLLEELRQQEPRNASVYLRLSGALAGAGRYQEALKHAITATELDPGIADYWYHAATLANATGYEERAVEWMAKAVALDPHNVALRSAQAHMLNSLDRQEAALRVLHDAMQEFPTDPGIRDLLLILLAQRAAAQSTDESASSFTDSTDSSPVEALVIDQEPSLLLPLPHARSARRDQDFARDGIVHQFLEAARIQLRVIIALTVRELSARTAKKKLGLLSAVLEPLLQIFMLGVVLTVFNHGIAPMGNSVFFYYSTGVMPFYLFIHVVEHNLDIFASNAPLLSVPRIRPIDLIFSKALTELVILGMTTVLVFSLFYMFGYGQGTDNIANAIPAYLWVFVFSFGVALIASVTNNLTHFWDTWWQTIQRFLYFLSGIFFYPLMWPAWIRDFLVWNPLLVGIEWFRSGFFHNYDPPWLDKPYMIGMSVGFVVVGLMLERATRRKLKKA